MKNNLESRIAYTYKIKGFEEVNGIRKFVVCSVLKDNIKISLPQYFPYSIVEPHNLINIGDEFTFSKYEDGVPKTQNLRIIYRKEDPKKNKETLHRISYKGTEHSLH